MEKKIKKTIYKEEKVGIVCDKCGVEVEDFSMDNDYVSFSHTFGYGTELDGTQISFDLCAKCFMELIKDIKYRKKEMF